MGRRGFRFSVQYFVSAFLVCDMGMGFWRRGEGVSIRLWFAENVLFLGEYVRCCVVFPSRSVVFFFVFVCVGHAAQNNVLCPIYNFSAEMLFPLSCLSPFVPLQKKNAYTNYK